MQQLSARNDTLIKYAIIASMSANMSPARNRLEFLLSRITILFIVSFIFLWLHILDDAIITNEPAWYGVSIPEFLFYCALVYAIVPPLGLWLARRGSIWGLFILLIYGFQAIYGAGLNHIKHLFGNYSGSQLLPTILNLFGIQITDIRGHGFATVLMGMAGLGITPPHTHILPSTVVAFINIGLNAALIILTALAIYTWFQARQAAGTATPSAHSETAARGQSPM